MVVIGERIVPTVLAHEDQSRIDGVADDPFEKTQPLPDEDHRRVCARRYARTSSSSHR